MSAEVLRFSVEVAGLPAVTAIGFGLNEHAGVTVLAPFTILHDRVTFPVYPFAGVMVITEVEDSPAVTELGFRVAAVAVNDGIEAGGGGGTEGGLTELIGVLLLPHPMIRQRRARATANRIAVEMRQPAPRRASVGVLIRNSLLRVAPGTPCWAPWDGVGLRFGRTPNHSTIPAARL